ncbi:DUF6406 domain-containing protein [Streptomyces asoensis]|uniref:DUF6406 domain-containing protein n=1 Tax=Streptomyces asoensis TaxID=249586 RepID=UPI0033EBF888
MHDELRLRLAIPERRNDVRFLLRDIYAPDEGAVTVYLTVAGEDVRKLALEIGGAFSVRDESWVVDRVDDLMSNDVQVVLRLVEQ